MFNRCQQVTLTSTPTSSRATTPLYHSVTASKRRQASYTLKIVKAKLHSKKKGKTDFEAECLAHIEIIEETANLEYILSEIRKRWGADYK